jgi:Brp/Blh family beta-carotene 15,15'-monooxygenase
MVWRRDVSPVLFTGLTLFDTGLLPWQTSWICALGAIILLGVPHGALDVEIARTLLRHRFKRAWFLVFAVPYLLLSGAVLLSWRLEPVGTLAAFLLASVWHFGAEDAKAAAVLEVVVRGGLPIAAPILLHPAATTLLLATIAAVPPAQEGHWLWIASLGWASLAVHLFSSDAILRRRRVSSSMVVLMFGLFVVAPPLTAFAIYFVCIHAPAHVRGLILDDWRAPRVKSVSTAAFLALPTTALTLMIGAALWPLYHGLIPGRLLSLTIQGLGALTLPHMLFDAWLGRVRSTADRAKFLRLPRRQPAVGLMIPSGD